GVCRRRPGRQAAARRQSPQQLAHAHAGHARHRSTRRTLGSLAAGGAARPQRYLMLRAYLAGARAAAQRWPLIIILFLINALFGFAFALSSGAWLNDALEGSLETRILWRTIDPNVLVDLWYHHREGLHMLLVEAVALAAIYSVLWWWLHGVVIASVQ